MLPKTSQNNSIIFFRLYRTLNDATFKDVQTMRGFLHTVLILSDLTTMFKNVLAFTYDLYQKSHC